MELLLCGTRFPTPRAPALGILDPGLSDSCLSVFALPLKFLLLRFHPKFLTLSCGGAHILLIPHHRDGMHVISPISHHLARHLTVYGGLAIFQLY